MNRLFLSSPCPADLNKMEAVEDGYFCKTCNKCVVDCREMSPEQLGQLPKNSCGIFSSEQVDIPNYSWTKSLAFRLLVVAGMMGFNVKPLSAQSANTNNPELVEIRFSDGSPTGKFKQKEKMAVHSDEVKKKRKKRRFFRRRRALKGKTYRRIGCPDF